MGTLYEKITALCKSKGVSGSRMCLDLGLSKSTMSDLKYGRTKGMSAITAQKIADYFDVSVGFLLGKDEKEKSPTPEGMELNETQSAALDLIMNMSEDQLRKFIQMAEIALGVPPVK